jgi:hypothetical protein
MTTEHKPALSLDGLGTKGHPASSSVAVIDGAELKASHAHLAKQSQVHELDASDQADAHGDMAKFTRDSDQIREDDLAHFNHGEGTYVADQQNDNVRASKSGAPQNSGSKNSGGGR